MKKPKAEKDYDEGDLEFLKKKKEEAAQLKALKDKASQKGRAPGSPASTECCLFILACEATSCAADSSLLLLNAGGFAKVKGSK